jgi:hypothetical protein
MNTSALNNRIDEIRELYSSESTPYGKRNLRKEYHELKDKISGNSRGVFISVGSMVLIFLVLIFFIYP